MGPISGKSQKVDTLVNALENMSEFFLNRHQDSSFIGNYSDELALKLQGLGKINYFSIKDQKTNTNIKYVPVRDLRLGLGVAYKYFAFDINVGLGLESKSSINNYRSFDVRARIFSSKQYFNTFLQFYQGYRMSNIDHERYSKTDEFTIRDDIRTIHFGIQYFYVLNYTKFSLKAPFVFNEWQKKSAGSFLFGANFNIFILDADSSMVPSILKPEFANTLHLRDLSNLSVGVSVGYMYTYVFKENFFVTVSLLPGLILNNGDHSISNRVPTSRHFNGRIQSLNSIGYNSRRFFAGINIEGDGYWIRVADKQRVEVGQGSGSIFVGYRFRNKN
ncbi:MAG: DUF4421 family protein [Salibacteraceae bacterium]